MSSHLRILALALACLVVSVALVLVLGRDSEGVVAPKVAVPVVDTPPDAVEELADTGAAESVSQGDPSSTRVAIEGGMGRGHDPSSSLLVVSNSRLSTDSFIGDRTLLRSRHHRVHSPERKPAPAPIRVTGVVRRDDERFKKAVVSAVRTNIGVTREKEVDADGWYEVGLETAGRVRLVFRDPFLEVQFEQEVDVPDVALFRFDVDLAAGSIRGTVTSNGEPVRDVPLFLRPLRPGPAPMCSVAMTDARGNYRIKGLPPGWYDVTVEGEKALCADETFPGAVVVAGEATDVDFDLDPGGSLRGVVLDENGVRASWARLIVRGGGEDFVQDVAGAFHVTGLPAGIVSVGAETEEGVCVQPATVTLGAGEVDGIELRLVPGGHVVVEALRPDGSALPATATIFGHAVPATARSIGDGMWKLGPVAKGAYVVRVEYEGAAVEEMVEVEPGETTRVKVTLAVF